MQLDRKSRKKSIDYSRSGGTHTAASLINAFPAASQVFVLDFVKSLSIVYRFEKADSHGEHVVLWPGRVKRKLRS